MQEITDYTLSAFHARPSDCALFAVSPGLFHSDHAFSLVTLDAASGAVALVGQIAPAGLFDFSYGGACGGCVVCMRVCVCVCV